MRFLEERLDKAVNLGQNALCQSVVESKQNWELSYPEINEAIIEYFTQGYLDISVCAKMMAEKEISSKTKK